MIGPIIEPQIFRNLTEGCENIELTGFMAQEDVFRYLKSFDIALSYHDTDHPVYNVAVPLKVVEYMAAGIPIVATKHCMYTNLLKDGRTTVLTNQNFRDFARGITYLLDNPGVAKRIAQRAYCEVEKYSIKKVVDQLETIYAELLK